MWVLPSLYDCSRLPYHADHTLQYYHPLRYFTVKRPMGEEYIGEVELEEGKSIHSEFTTFKHASS